MIIPSRHRRELVLELSLPASPLSSRPTPRALSSTCSGWSCLTGAQKAGIIIGALGFVVLLGILVSFLFAKWAQKKELELRKHRRRQLRARPDEILPMIQPPAPPSLPTIPIMMAAHHHHHHQLLDTPYSLPAAPPMPHMTVQPMLPPPYGQQVSGHLPPPPQWPHAPTCHYAIPGARAMPTTQTAQMPVIQTSASPARPASAHRPSTKRRAPRTPRPPSSQADDGQDTESDNVTRPESRSHNRSRENNSHTRKRRHFWPFSFGKRNRAPTYSDPEEEEDDDDDADSNNAWAGSDEDEDDDDDDEGSDYVPQTPPSPRARETYPRELLADRARRRAWNQYSTLPVGRVSTVPSDTGDSRNASPTPSDRHTTGVTKDNVPPARRMSRSGRRRAERRAASSVGDGRR